MKSYAMRALGLVLAIVLSGVLEPMSAWAQTTTTQPTTQTPAAQDNQTAAPADVSSQTTHMDTEQQPQSPERQSQQDKASQQMINAAPESGTQLPESPDTVRARQEAARAQQTTPANQPSGTAAAEEAHPAGAVASRPAGAAIAPASQKRVRSFLIKLGIVAGVGAAAGTVYGLSRASGPKPPGAK